MPFSWLLFLLLETVASVKYMLPKLYDSSYLPTIVSQVYFNSSGIILMMISCYGARKCIILWRKAYRENLLISISSSLPFASLVSERPLVATGHVTTCNPNVFTGIESTNTFIQPWLKRTKRDRYNKKHAWESTPLKFFSLILCPYSFRCPES